MRPGNDGRAARCRAARLSCVCCDAVSCEMVTAFVAGDVEHLVADLERVGVAADDADLEDLGEDLAGLQVVVATCRSTLTSIGLLSDVTTIDPERVGLRRGRRGAAGRRRRARPCVPVVVPVVVAGRGVRRRARVVPVVVPTGRRRTAAALNGSVPKFLAEIFGRVAVFGAVLGAVDGWIAVLRAGGAALVASSSPPPANSRK